MRWFVGNKKPTPPPFLVIGAGRGGTSVLGSMLDAHPDVSMGMEAFSKEYLLGLSLAHKDFEQMVEERTKAFFDACDNAALTATTPYWGNKITTEQLYGLETYNAIHPHHKDVLAEFFGYRPETKVVFILRDGRNCIASKVKHTGQAYELATARWRYSVKVYEYLTAHYPQLCAITFEALVIDPEATLQRISDFLDIPYDEAMLSGTAGTRMPSEYRRKEGVMDKAAIANDVALPNYVTSIITDDLTRCGYAA